MEALNDDGVNIIGVWGMGGVGKTTLVNEVGRKAKESKLFDKVLNVVVSQNQNIEKIQDRVAESLNLILDKKSEVGKAEQLWVRLQNEKSILIIIDDLWKKLDLKAVGIPIGEHHKGCKILLTTRSQKEETMKISGASFEGMKSLKVLDLNDIMASLSQDTFEFLTNLRTLYLKYCYLKTYNISSLGKLKKLEILSFCGSDIEMTVFNCKKLKYVFSPMLARTLPQLHSLRIKKCEDLEQIIDTTSSSEYPDLQSISFPTLHVIIIERCNNLKYAFPVSIVHDVPQLGAISISCASKLEQVFGCEDKADAKDHDQGQERVELPRLTHVILEKLPSLRSFSSVDYQFIFPSSIWWEVDDCPQMTITPSLVHHRGDIQDRR
ncbi:Disease resistance protein [Corchorus olitorius]|uniref:Disease resistance protein n=1 Tax=Corchorus olitorius TaxID=93759 RepID=A0A1R3KVI1_9ROSI|nr:Disease resistance protein [Corchorus olitorius]